MMEFQIGGRGLFGDVGASPWGGGEGVVVGGAWGPGLCLPGHGILISLTGTQGGECHKVGGCLWPLLLWRSPR